MVWMGGEGGYIWPKSKRGAHIWPKSSGGGQIWLECEGEVECHFF